LRSPHPMLRDCLGAVGGARVGDSVMPLDSATPTS
jgi:hypothetical protein